jgi:arylsulfatase A-like enzyme
MILRANAGDFIRAGDWKLVPWLGSGGFTKPTLIKGEAGEAPGQLYDLAADPGETRNVWRDHPEVVERLSKQMKAALEADHTR